MGQALPGLIPDSPVLAQPIPADGFQLERNLIQAVEVGHTDTDETSVLHVSSLGLMVAGDVAYNGVHQYILEGGNGRAGCAPHALRARPGTVGPPVAKWR
ncbi:hypothetical protein [Streptomyces sp. NPDC097610]|uniref:hypothetical protein n=1 Tax=Streptomyces sp. NPDC097610 TaxID=3157227 RepID=UPI0033301DF6